MRHPASQSTPAPLAVPTGPQRPRFGSSPTLETAVLAHTPRPTAQQTLTALTAQQVPDPHRLATHLLTAALNGGDLERSVGNCHVDGVDSVVLFDDRDSGGGMMRYFFAKHGSHGLHQLLTRRGHYTLGIHNHRYPLALIPLAGHVVNVQTAVAHRPTGTVLHEYGFRSALVDDDTEVAATVYRRAQHVHPIEQVRLDPGAACLMDASDLHTVQVPELKDLPGTAWLVVEGPDAGLGSAIYSPRDDLTISREGLYRPMSRDRALRLTEDVLGMAERG